MRTDPAELQTEDRRRRIGVIAGREGGNARPMLSALQGAFPVDFEEIASAEEAGGVDGLLSLDGMPAAGFSGAIPRLMLPPRVAANGRETLVHLSEDRGLPRALRGRTFPEQTALGPPPVTPPDGARVLATAEGSPVWWRVGGDSASLYLSAYPLGDLTERDALIDHLCAGHFMGLLPLLHFLGDVLGTRGWTPPPLRASFVIDDPNLHWPSYGFLKYAELIAHATKHGYHVGFATVPLDGWLVNRRATSLLQENPSRLSLLMHGNDHVARELGRLSTDRDADASIARALLRVSALEDRSGLSVNRVMAPPHGACSEQALRAMFRLGLEAACVSRPYPWRDGLAPPTPLAGWRPAELVAGGLPVLPRYSLGLPRDDLAFRALLGQPLILYGHHGDFAGGLDLLAEAAAEINGLGDVEWSPVGAIARGNYATRRTGDILHVTMYSRRLAVDVPDGIRAVRVTLQESLGGAQGHRITHPAGASALTFAGGIGTTTVAPVSSPTQLELRLEADLALDPGETAGRGVRPWPLLRRLAVEGRDRIQPLLARS